jgi:hypothetical protein
VELGFSQLAKLTEAINLIVNQTSVLPDSWLGESTQG